MRTSSETRHGPGIVTLMTDFGDTDGYAGSMKGVLLSRAPGVRIVDITHHIPPFQVASAAYVLDTYFSDYPSGTVHLVVVDPGVGSERKPVAVRFSNQYFVAPDNGVLSLILSRGGPYKAWEIRRVTPPRGEVSPTFHGRDIFAPAAAHLAAGRPAHRLGPALAEIFLLDAARPRISDRRITGQVVHIDHFGNLITNIRGELLRDTDPRNMVFRVATYNIMGLSQTYADRQPGELLTYIGSSGLLEIGIVKGSAASAVRTPLGREVTVMFRTKK